MRRKNQILALGLAAVLTGGIRGPGFCRVRAYRTGSGAGA